MHIAHNLIDVKVAISNIELDIKYATHDNFTHKIIYPVAKCYLLKHVVQALKNASEEFNKLDYKIKIWDGYRPLQAQHIFWNLVPDERYVADPKKGSRHNRGCAVDLTLTDYLGNELDMGTSFDDFTEKAHRNYKDFAPKVLQHRQLLQTIMEKHGFIGWKNEWWHFDYKDWESHPILDIPFTEIKLNA
jgi:zinc D-Ala-D-Ala dipeptidase